MVELDSDRVRIGSSWTWVELDLGLDRVGLGSSWTWVELDWYELDIGRAGHHSCLIPCKMTLLFL